MRVLIDLNTENTDDLRAAIAFLQSRLPPVEVVPEWATIRAGGTSSDDDADERVRQDWSAEADKNYANMPIKRSEVVLKVGDRIKMRDGDDDAIASRAIPGSSGDWLTVNHGQLLYSNGCYFIDGEKCMYDAVSVNGRPIIDGE